MFTMDELLQHVLPALYERLDACSALGLLPEGYSTVRESIPTLISFTLYDSQCIFTIDTALDGNRMSQQLEITCNETDAVLAVLTCILEVVPRRECVTKVIVNVMYHTQYIEYIQGKAEFQRPTISRVLTARIAAIVSGVYNYVIINNRLLY